MGVATPASERGYTAGPGRSARPALRPLHGAPPLVQQALRARRRPSAARSAPPRARSNARRTTSTSPTPMPARNAAPIAVVSDTSGHHHRAAEHVRLELHQPGVRDRATVRAQLREPLPGGSLHRLDRVDRLVGDRLQRGPREVLASRAARDARRSCRAHTGPSAASRAPSGRARSRRRRWSRATRAMASVSPGSERIPSPSRSHCTAAPGHEHACLEGVVGAIVDAPGDGGQQARPHRRRAGPGVLQHEAAGAVGVLAEPRVERGLAEQRRLLVAGHAGERRADPDEGVGVGVAEHLGRRRPPRAAPPAARRARRTARRPSAACGCRTASCATRSSSR